MNKIGWCDRTWNPVTGCTPVSRECDNCWAARMSKRLAGRYGYPATPHQFDVRIHPDRLHEPLHWRKPARVFVVSMGDLFHPVIPGMFLRRIFEVMCNSPRHTFLLLTKRAQLMAEWCKHDNVPANVWLNMTAGYQETIDKRIPFLLRTPAAVRGVSIEPMLGPVYLGDYLCKAWSAGHLTVGTYLDWVILGCETGPGRRHTEMAWMLDVAAQTLEAGVSLYVKQVEIDGRVSHNPAEWPVELRRREFPDSTHNHHYGRA